MLKLDIDFTYIHNSKCELFNYLRHFLREGAPEDQIEEEIKKALHDIAFHTRDRIRAE